MATKTPMSASPRETRRTPAGPLGPLAGLLFVVLFVVSFAVLNTPDGDAGDEEWRTYWLDSDHRTEGIVASLAMLVAAAAFLWMLGDLRRRIGPAVGGDAAFGAGVTMASLLMVAGFAAGLIPVGHELADVPIPQDPDVVRMIDGGYFGVLFLAVPYAMAALMLALFVALQGDDLLPGWLKIATVVVGIVALSGPFLFVVPHALFLIWTLVVCITLLMSDRRTPRI